MKQKTPEHPDPEVMERLALMTPALFVDGVWMKWSDGCVRLALFDGNRGVVCSCAMAMSTLRSFMVAAQQALDSQDGPPPAKTMQ